MTDAAPQALVVRRQKIVAGKMDAETGASLHAACRARSGYAGVSTYIVSPWSFRCRPRRRGMLPATSA